MGNYYYYGAHGRIRRKTGGVIARMLGFFRSGRIPIGLYGILRTVTMRRRRFAFRIAALLLLYGAVFTALVWMQFRTGTPHITMGK